MISLTMYESFMVSTLYTFIVAILKSKAEYTLLKNWMTAKGSDEATTSENPQIVLK